jgi:hypothetical protein
MKTQKFKRRKQSVSMTRSSVTENLNQGKKVLVFLSRFKFTAGKLKSKWTGPYEVVRVSPYGVVELFDKTTTTFQVNGHRLKIYEGEEIPDIEETLYLKNA